MIGYNFSEKRRAARIYNQVPLTYEITDHKTGDTRQKTVMTKNISPEGVYFHTDEILPLDMELTTRLQLPQGDGNFHHICASMRITRVEVIKSRNIFGIGAVFVGMPDGEKMAIDRLVERLNISKLLELTIKKGASDLHLLADHPPALRLHGELEILTEVPPLSAEEVPQLLYNLMSDEQIRIFESEKELDFGIQYDKNNRFRINMHRQRGFVEATLRLITSKIFSFEDLKIPNAVKDLARLKEGLVLITGPTGSGKSTTMAAMVGLINQERKTLIITLERPIEYVHTNDKSVIKQREIGIDTNSFSIALKSSLRQDPNIIVVGELDDTETARTALIAAEAGYLVIASFHAPSALQALDRLANIFPPENRRQILSQLANSIKGVVSQLLVPGKYKQGRILVSEVVIVNDAVKKIIRNDELVQLSTIIQTSASFKMQSMTDALKRAVEKDLIDMETANSYSEDFARYNR